MLTPIASLPTTMYLNKNQYGSGNPIFKKHYTRNKTVVLSLIDKNQTQVR